MHINFALFFIRRPRPCSNASLRVSWPERHPPREGRLCVRRFHVRNAGPGEQSSPSAPCPKPRAGAEDTLQHVIRAPCGGVRWSLLHKQDLHVRTLAEGESERLPRAAGGQPASRCSGPSTEALRPAGSWRPPLVAQPTQTQRSARCLSSVGCPYANPNSTSDLIRRGLSYREHARSNTPPAWEKGISAQECDFPLGTVKLFALTERVEPWTC